MAKNKKPYDEKWKRLEDKPFAEGGHGRAYHVIPISGEPTDKKFVLKELKKTGDPERRHRFKTEVLALRKLSHPLVSQVVDDNIADYATDGVSLFFVSEYAGKLSLEDLVKKSGPASVGTACAIGMSMLNTLAYCHSKGIVHRDIKPDNVILNSEQEPVLIDFGQSFDAEDTKDSQATPDWQHMGSRFLYLPELRNADGKPNDKRDLRSDVTLTAGIFFYLVTGIEPVSLLDGNDQAPHQRQQARARLEELAEAKQLLSLFDKAFRTSIEHRFQTADELRVAIERLISPPADKGKLPDLRTALTMLREQGNYKNKEEKSKFLEVIGSAIDNASMQVQQYTLENKFARNVSGNQIDLDSLTLFKSVGFQDKIENSVQVTCNFEGQFIGSELVVTAWVNQGETEELWRCPLDCTNTGPFEDKLRAYFQRTVTETVAKWLE